MQPDELDRLLSKEGTISPSSKFTAAVMSNIRREAATPKGIAFPWKPVVFGVLSAAVAVGAGAGGAVHPLLDAWTINLAAGAGNPIVSALALAVVVPLVIYGVYQHAQD